jgi:DNA polymerase-3 subunit epsilon
VFRKSLSAWNLEFIDATFGCTLRLAQTALPKLPTFNLHYLSVELNLSPFNHHDALADAETCAEVALKLATTNPRWLEIGNWPKSGLTKSAINQAPSTGELYDTALRFVGHEQNRVKGKLFTFTGTMHLVRHREDIDPVLNALGAGRLETTGKKTDYLVVGDEDIRMFAPGKSHSRKYEKAFDLRAAGQEIEIISEQEFRRMLPGELVEQLLRIR